MTDQLSIERCSETGICSIGRGGTEKLDLMPDEVDAIRESNGDPARIAAVLSESDSAFAARLQPEELAVIWEKLA